MTAPNPSFIWSFFLSAASFAALCVATSSLLARDSTILGRPSAKSHEVLAMKPGSSRALFPPNLEGSPSRIW